MPRGSRWLRGHGSALSPSSPWRCWSTPPTVPAAAALKSRPARGARRGTPAGGWLRGAHHRRGGRAAHRGGLRGRLSQPRRRDRDRRATCSGSTSSADRASTCRTARWGWRAPAPSSATTRRAVVAPPCASSAGCTSRPASRALTNAALYGIREHQPRLRPRRHLEPGSRCPRHLAAGAAANAFERFRCGTGPVTGKVVDLSGHPRDADPFPSTRRAAGVPRRRAGGRDRRRRRAGGAARRRRVCRFRGFAPPARAHTVSRRAAPGVVFIDGIRCRWCGRPAAHGSCGRRRHRGARVRLARRRLRGAATAISSAPPPARR